MSERRTRKRTKLAIEMVEESGDWSWAEDALGMVQAAAAEVATEPALRFETAAATVVLSSDGKVAELNATYRGKRGPTNVLSFPAGNGASEGYIGDIVLACQTVLREAEAEDITPEHHLQHLVVHGLLHLLGYDHERAADAEMMEALEIQILNRLGIANPYTGPLDTAKT